MEMKRLNHVYFSPTETTKSVLQIIARLLKMEFVEHDITDYICRDVKLKFGADDIVIFGFPVYGGRVPKIFVDRMNDIKGHFTSAVLIATYGNREYEDALLEMKNIAKANGFSPIGAAAIVTEHSVIRSIATGRPDAKDMAFIEKFCTELKKKIAAITPEESSSEFYVPGKEPYVKRIKLPMAPSVSASCISCGLCAKKCPVGAIDIHNPGKTDSKKCIGCMRCVRVCPKEARHISKIKMATGKWILCALFKANLTRKEPEMFF